MRLGIDLDDVLADTVKSFLKYYNNKYNHSFKKKDITHYFLKNILGVTQEEMNDIFKDFFNREIQNIPTVYGSKKAIKELKDKYELVIVTDRPQYTIIDSMDWVEENFPKSFKEFYFTKVSGITKGEACELFDISIVVEDNLDNALDIIKHNSQVMLLDKPWNKGRFNYGGIERFSSWKKILEDLKLYYEGEQKYTR